MHTNDAGRMIERWWHEAEQKFPGIETSVFTVMPNHLHGIVVLTGTGHRESVLEPSHPATPADQSRRGGPTCPPPPPLHRVVQWFKTMTTNEYIRGVKEHNWPSFPGRLWQRNYYERVIRSDEELLSIHQYILDNPARWPEDQENPHSP